MSELQAKFDGLIAEQRKLKKQFQADAQEMFRGITKEFFDKNPSITAFKWAQYTPYFNDGDPCEFRVNAPTFTNAPLDELDEVSSYGEYEGETEGVWATDTVRWVLESDSEYNKDSKHLLQASNVDVDSCEKMSGMIQCDEMEEVMLDMFGDHVEIVATRNGFDVEEYDHD